METADLFGDLPENKPRQLSLGEGAFILRGFVREIDHILLREVEAILAQAPLRHMVTPGGLRMSVAMSNCGSVGWVADRNGYRYDAHDPVSGLAWPAMPAVFLDVAKRAAACAGFENFVPDACLINRYEPGTRLSLHQDKDERDASAPIVSVSLGLPAIFLFGGAQRNVRPLRYPLEHGDVVVWGGPSRFNFHGVVPIAEGHHPLTGSRRINLTFRKAL
jgi:alkylated DNA repair protein (DNA oxidative demethylase)